MYILTLINLKFSAILPLDQPILHIPTNLCTNLQLKIEVKQSSMFAGTRCIKRRCIATHG